MVEDLATAIDPVGLLNKTMATTATTDRTSAVEPLISEQVPGQTFTGLQSGVAGGQRTQYPVPPSTVEELRQRDIETSNIALDVETRLPDFRRDPNAPTELAGSRQRITDTLNQFAPSIPELQALEIKEADDTAPLTPSELQESARSQTDAKIRAFTNTKRLDGMAELTEDFDNSIRINSDGSFPSTPFLKRHSEGDEIVYEKMEKEFGLNDVNVNNFGSVATVAAMELSKGIATFKYHGGMNEEGNEHLGSKADEFEEGVALENDMRAVNAKDSSLNPEERIAKSLKLLHKAFRRPDSQPILRSMLGGVRSTMSSLLNNGQDVGVKGNYGAAAFLEYMTEKGMISWGVNKQGRVVPINTSDNVLNTFGNDILLKAYLANLRDPNINYPNAQRTPFNKNKFASEKRNISIAKNGKSLEGNDKIAEQYLTDRSNVGIQINPLGYEMMTKMVFDMKRAIDKSQTGMNGGIPHPMAETLGEVGPKSFKKYLRRAKRARQDERLHLHQEILFKTLFEDPENTFAQQAQRQIDINWAGIQRDLEEKIRPIFADGETRFINHVQSQATNRVFAAVRDLQYMNGKGVIRMALSFANVDPITVTSADLEVPSNNIENSKVMRLAKSALSTDGTSGVNLGYTVKQKLDALPEKDMQLLDYHYALGLVLGKMNGIKFSDPVAAVRHGLTNFKTAVGLSKEIVGWQEGQAKLSGMTNEQLQQQPDSFEGLSTELQGLINGHKGEWMYPVSVLSQAIKLENIKQGIPGSSLVKFDYTMEMDATQSNAANMSLIMGDTEIALTLGLLEGVDTREFGDLRDKIWKNIQNDVENALTGPEDRPGKEAYKNFFNKINNLEGANPAKLYARGLVVAGLYGKTSRKMYSEAREMFDQINALDEDIMKDLESEYGGNTKQMEEDLAEIFTSSMKASMGSLYKYQNFMKGTGTIISMINGSTDIEGFLGPITLAKDNLLPMHDVSREIKERLLAESDPERMNIGQVDYELGRYVKVNDSGVSSANNIKKRSFELAKELGIVNDNPGELGSQVTNAIPVDLVQSADAYMMFVAALMASKPDGKPLNQLGIHDASITTAGSTLKFKNAYDNIAYHMAAQRAPEVMSSVISSMGNQLESLREKHLGDYNAAVIAGEEPPLVSLSTVKTASSKGELSGFSGVTAYLDKINARINDNSFYSPRELARPQVANQVEQQTKYNKVIIEEAKKLGYEPPNSNDPNSDFIRATMRVDGKEFAGLLTLIEESLGLSATSQWKSNLGNRDDYINRVSATGRKYKATPNSSYSAMLKAMITSQRTDGMGRKVKADSENKKLRELMSRVKKWNNNLVY